MAIGYLQIQARTAQDAIPIGGAQVRVLDDEGNTLYRLSTDESGETQPVSLETVDRSFSLNPGYMGTPYANYGAVIEAEGFQPVTVAEIPIFDGETAVLPAALVPLEEQKTRRTGVTIVIGPPAVSMSGPRNQEGSSADPRVLRQVVIPNPITVHLGAPGAAAANVQVPFSDYIKNTASSEIYPTWPEAALKANIYAIMTFALNRIYTEWYRNQGYAFDITNDTAYDQYYVPGRPVYDSISRTADELFGEYARRQGQTAPYFTSFCNGQRPPARGCPSGAPYPLRTEDIPP